MAAVAAPPPTLLPTASGSRPTSASSIKNEVKEEPTVTVAEVNSNVEVIEPTPELEKKGSTTGKSPKADAPSLPDSPTNPQRPPIRPNIAARSKFELEPNPFEQSFSRSSHHSSSSLSDRDKGGNTPPRGGDATSIKHHALPPLSSLTSPAAADPSQFPWLANQSLRTGPLSPAMLAGPASHGQNGNGSSLRANNDNGQNDQPFDGTTFRTGFTPGTGSGFTPGYNSLMNGSFNGALPMPSPNTAAFLNMVTNSTPLGEGENASTNPPQDGNSNPTHNLQQPPSAIPPHMQNHHGLSHLAPPDAGQDTITPNTLSALTGVFNDMNRQNSGVNMHQPMPQHQHQPQHMGPGPGMTHHQSYYPMPHGTAPPPLPHAHHSLPHPHAMGMPPPPHIDYAQQSANAASQAANGLFLLTQAHQELSKREEENRGSIGSNGSVNGQQHGMIGGPGAPLMNKRTSIGSVPPGSGKPGMSINTSTNNVAGQKRKSDTMNSATLASAVSSTGGKPKKNKKSPKGNRNGGIKDESASPAFGGSDGDDDDFSNQFGGNGNNGLGPDGKPETEEEKRKNFLERNRQAALKCRQRKKAWLNELQIKVEGLSAENENLQRTVQGLHEEIARLTGVLMQHRDCGINMQGGYGRPIR